jgi:Leucine-rich repeat (LRR) protein
MTKAESKKLLKGDISAIQTALNSLSETKDRDWILKGVSISKAGVVSVSPESVIANNVKDHLHVFAALMALEIHGQIPDGSTLDLGRSPTLLKLRQNDHQLRRKGINREDQAIEVGALPSTNKFSKVIAPECVAALKSLSGLKAADLGGAGPADLAAFAAHQSELESLTLTDCYWLTDLSGLAILDNLTHLDLSGCREFTGLAGLGVPSRLETLVIHGRKRATEKTKNGMTRELHLMRLQKLDFAGTLPSLRVLDISGCDQLSSMAGLKNLPVLKTLRLRGCTSLKALGSINGLTQLTEVDVSGCEGISRISPLKNLPSLVHLNLDHVAKIKNLDGLAELQSLSSLSMIHTGRELRYGYNGQLIYSRLKDVSALGRLASLRTVTIQGHSEISWSGLAKAKSLEKVLITDSAGLDAQEMLTAIGQLSSLEELDLNKLPTPVDFGPLSALKQLRVLSIRNVLAHRRGVARPSLSPLQGLTKLEQLDLATCSFESVEPLGGLTLLKELRLPYRVRDISALKGLKQLTLGVEVKRGKAYRDGEELMGVDLALVMSLGSGGLAGLKHADLTDCIGVQDFSFLRSFTALKVLKLTNCRFLKSADNLAPLVSLETLLINGTTPKSALWRVEMGLLEIDGLKGLKSLKKLMLNRNAGLKNIAPISGLLNLNTLRLSGCKGVEDIESLQPIVDTGCKISWPSKRLALTPSS